MASWKAVLRTEEPICERDVASHRTLLEQRGIRQVRIQNPAFEQLRQHIAEHPKIVTSRSGKMTLWAMANAKGDQHTMGSLKHSGGSWKVSGWAAEHLVCLTAGLPMVTLKNPGLILKPRVRRMVLHFGSMCHFCSEPMPLNDITVEHWLAKSLGGDSRPENLKLAHRACNELAGSLSIGQKNRLRRELTENAKLRAVLLHRAS